jgi:outer membrane protein assembly factor BamB
MNKFLCQIFIVCWLVPFSNDLYSLPPDTTQFRVSAASQVHILIGTFLGNEQRNYYGQQPPSSLNVKWKKYLGKGKTVISRKLGEREWAGAGWTGQPLLTEENGKLYLIQGAYDHHLKKIDVENQNLVWQYKFDDVIKGTGSLWKNDQPESKKDEIVIFQGSRLGVDNYLDSKHIPSYRAVSYNDGSELWRLDVRWTDSYSRDVDGSALIIDDTLYIGLENSMLTLIDPNIGNAQLKDGMLQPEIIQETPLYTKEDVILHKNNVVTESSPCKLGNHLYITSGAGHVYGFNLKTKTIDWDFYIGSDIDGSPVVTRDSCLLIAVEKQYIEGPGGVYKLDPSKPPAEATVWYLPTADTNYYGWKGGVIGSVGTNDYYNDGSAPSLAAFTSIDGYLYVVEHTILNTSEKVKGPDGQKNHYAPRIIKKIKTGPSISTPLIIDNKIIAAGYNGIRIFSFDGEGKIQLLDHYPGEFEATPIVWNKCIYVASRNGYLYCFGN